MTTTLPPRNEVPVEQTWDLDSIFATPADWEAACQQLHRHCCPRLSAYQGTPEKKARRRCWNTSTCSRRPAP